VLGIEAGIAARWGQRRRVGKSPAARGAEVSHKCEFAFG